MLKALIASFLLIFFTACGENGPENDLDGKKLLESKCASCHNLNMPPLISEDELAPPMMSISFHMRGFMEASNESQRTSKAIEFVVDYVRNPSLKKAFCDEASIKRYGLMPSQKEKVTEKEARAIASHMFQRYTQKKLSKIQREQAAYDALDAGEKLAIKYECLGCHKKEVKTVGPSFVDIAKRRSDSRDLIEDNVKNGSAKQWKNSNGAIMPAFKSLSDEELKELSAWILNFNS